MPLATTNASGAAVAPTGTTMPGYPGQLRTLADLYYNRHRDYDSSTGRYIQADPIGLEGGSNVYLYAEGNPLRYVDPTGEFGFVGAAIGGGIDLVEQLGSNGGNWRCVNWKSVGANAVLGAFTGGAARGSFLFKGGSHTWGATRKWLGKSGFAKKWDHGHHWLIEQNSKWGKKFPEWFKNQPWNINPMNAARHRRLHQLPPALRKVVGAPSWAQGAVAGIGITAGGDGCGCQ